MDQCLSAPEIAGLEDAEDQDAKLLTEKLSTDLIVKVFALTTETMADVNKKIEAVHGRQPKLAVKSRMTARLIHAKHEETWYAGRWDTTVQEIGKTNLKYSDITDILKAVKIMSHVHWAMSINESQYSGNSFYLQL